MNTTIFKTTTAEDTDAADSKIFENDIKEAVKKLNLDSGINCYENNSVTVYDWVKPTSKDKFVTLDVNSHNGKDFKKIKVYGWYEPEWAD